MNLKTFEKNYDVKLLEIKAVKGNEILVRVLVNKIGTDLYDEYGWTPDCYGAEPHLGKFFDGYETIDMMVMEYIREKIWFKLPCPLANEKELEIVKQINKN